MSVQQGNQILDPDLVLDPQSGTDAAMDRLEGNGPGGERWYLERAFEHSLEDTHVEGHTPLVDKLKEYQDAILHGAAAAKSQFDTRFGGANASGQRFVIDRIHSGYFGYDSWENVSVTGGGTTNWIDDDTPDNISGTGGISNPLSVGGKAVHVVLGFGTDASNPKVTRIRYEVNSTPRPAVSVKEEWHNTDMQIKWLDRPILLVQGSEFAADLYAEDDGNEDPYLEGVSFIAQSEADLVDPANMAGTTTSEFILAD